MSQPTLSAVETEQVRDIRARLGRVPKGPMGDKSVGPLSKGFFDVCARVGIGAGPERPEGLDMPHPSLMAETIREAGIDQLQNAVTDLHTIRKLSPTAWRVWFDHGVPQAILTRRLVLGGREQL